MITIPNVVKCAMRYRQGTLEAYNIMYVLCPGPASGANLATIAGVFQTWWNGTFRAVQSSNISWLGVDLTAMDSPGSPFLAYTNTGTLTGAVGSVPFPPQVTVAISLKTGLSGRSYRGRIYHIGLLAANVITDGTISPAQVVSMTGWYNTLRTALTAAGFPWCVASLYSGVDVNGDKIPRLVGVPTVVTSIVVGSRVDTQRRRLPAEARA